MRPNTRDSAARGTQCRADSEIQLTLSAEHARALQTVLEQLVAGRPAEPVQGLAGLAERIRNMLRDARNLLPGDVAGEAACEMLLLLYCAEVRGEQVTVTSLGSSMGLAHATSSRRTSALSEAGMIEFHPDQCDRRRRFVVLTRSAFNTITSWLEQVER